MSICVVSSAMPSISSRNLSSLRVLTDSSVFLSTKMSSLSLTSSNFTSISTVIRMGGGPRTFPGGVSKWQWKRMQAKKAKQLLKARLMRERQIYEMRKRAELKAAVSELEKPWEVVEKAPTLFSVKVEEQLKALADRFQKPGGYDLWSDRDGPQVFAAPDGLPSARFFPKGVVHSIKPYGRISNFNDSYVSDGDEQEFSGSVASDEMKERNEYRKSNKYSNPRQLYHNSSENTGRRNLGPKGNTGTKKGYNDEQNDHIEEVEVLGKSNRYSYPRRLYHNSSGNAGRRNSVPKVETGMGNRCNDEENDNIKEIEVWGKTNRYSYPKRLQYNSTENMDRKNPVPQIKTGKEKRWNNEENKIIPEDNLLGMVKRKKMGGYNSRNNNLLEGRKLSQPLPSKGNSYGNGDYRNNQYNQRKNMTSRRRERKYLDEDRNENQWDRQGGERIDLSKSLNEFDLKWIDA